MNFVNLILITSLTISNYAWSNTNSFPLEDKCQSNMFDMFVTLTSAKADSILCLNKLNGYLEHDKVVAEACFANERIRGLIRRQPAFRIYQECQERFISECSENYDCRERDDSFGGMRTQCGHLGFFIDFLNRVRKANPGTFTPQTGVNLCIRMLEGS